MFRSASSLLTAAAATATAGLLTLGTAAAQHHADYAEMFNPSGHHGSQAPAELHGILPPEVGGAIVADLFDPGAVQGWMLVGLGTSTGIPVLLPPEPLSLYLDPAGIMTDVPVPLAPSAGSGVVQLPLPPDPGLAGFDLALQGLTMNGFGELHASNLLCANVGFFGAPGGAVFSFEWNVNLDARSYYEDAKGDPQAIYTNTSGSCVRVTITGAKNASRGDLQIRDQNGATVATVGASSTVISVTVRVPNNGKLFFYNAGNGAMNQVRWQIATTNC